jgi:hypothetical protein
MGSRIQNRSTTHSTASFGEMSQAMSHLNNNYCLNDKTTELCSALRLSVPLYDTDSDRIRPYGFFLRWRPIRGKFCFVGKVSADTLKHSRGYRRWGTLFSGIKRLEHVTEHWSPSTTEVLNALNSNVAKKTFITTKKVILPTTSWPRVSIRN